MIPIPKLIYKSKTSSYGDKSTTFSHVEYPRPLYALVDNTGHLKTTEHDDIRTPTSFINLSKNKKTTTSSNDAEVKKGFNLIDFPKKAFKGLVKVGTNISNIRYGKKYKDFIRLLCEPVHSNKNKFL